MPHIDHLLWLQQRVGYEALPGSAFDAAMSFALLWMYFEGQACGTEANPKKLRDFAKDLYSRKLDDLRGKLDEPLMYFKSRYRAEVDSEEFLHRLGDPKRIKPDDKVAILAALRENTIDEVDKAIGLLMICFRIRNNLFHGTKQIPTLQQQADLFLNVGMILRTLLEAR